MTEWNEQESDFSRHLQALPFNDAPRPEHAKHLRQQVLARFDQALRAGSTRPWWRLALNQGRTIMRRPVPRLIAVSAACLAIFATWQLLPGRPSTAQAFHRMVETMVQAKTARFQMEAKVEGQPPLKCQAWYLAPGKYRQEMDALVNIADVAAGKTVTLIPAQKKATLINFKGAPKDKLNDLYFERLRQLLADKRDAKDNQYERLGEKTIDGKQAVGFRQDSPAATITLWGNLKSGQPVRIETVFSGIPRTEVVMTNFEFNVEIKPSLFDLATPAGYKTQSFDVDASPTREQDVIAALKAYSEMSGGEFPANLATTTVTEVIVKSATSQGKELSDDKTQELMTQATKIGRGFEFALSLPESAEASYAGKGVKRDTKDTPIFWYKSEGTNKYRVVYADLTVRDADTAPQVAGASRIEKASKANKPPEK